jgi:DnaA-homolog protein
MTKTRVPLQSSYPQLALNVRLRDAATFSTYYSGPNSEPLKALTSLVHRSLHLGKINQIYLWGAPATGKSHLLQALCHESSLHETSCIYLPLGTLGSTAPQILENMGRVTLICVDDVDAIIGDRGWEMGLFNMINVVREAGCILIITSRQNPTYFTTLLPDLLSRLLWGPVYKLQMLDDTDKLYALQAHARQRGITLSDEVSRYMLNHCRRDLVSLLAMLDRLDAISLATQRKITVPFVKTYLDVWQA